jgi:Uri superfamily endonuclease
LTKGGLYQLHLTLTEPRTIRIGKLGSFYFPKGKYIYTGSAQNGLEGRIARHLRKTKKFHWHVDYLLKYSKIEKIAKFPWMKTECKLHKVTLIKMKGENFIEGFGSSDCGCGGHLMVLRLT